MNTLARWVMAAFLAGLLVVQTFAWREGQRSNCLARAQIAASAFIAGNYAEGASPDRRRDIAQSLTTEADDC